MCDYTGPILFSLRDRIRLTPMPSKEQSTWINSSPILSLTLSKKLYFYTFKCIKGRLPWHQSGNLRVRGSNLSASRQPLTPGCQLNNKWFSAKTVCLQWIKIHKFFFNWFLFLGIKAMRYCNRWVSGKLLVNHQRNLEVYFDHFLFQFRFF